MKNKCERCGKKDKTVVPVMVSVDCYLPCIIPTLPLCHECSEKLKDEVEFAIRKIEYGRLNAIKMRIKYFLGI